MLESSQPDLDSDLVRLKLYNRILHQIQTIECNLLSQNYLHIKNYIIWRPLAFIYIYMH